MAAPARHSKKGCKALSVTFGDSSPRGRAKVPEGTVTLKGELLRRALIRKGCKALSVTFGDSSPKGRAKAPAGAVTQSKVNRCAWLSLEKTFGSLHCLHGSAANFYGYAARRFMEMLRPIPVLRGQECVFCPAPVLEFKNPPAGR